MERFILPWLTRLRSPFGDMAMITRSRFPNLRHLELHNMLLVVDNYEELPSLQTLKITIFGDKGWSEPLRACRKSLVSLQLTCPAGYCISQEPRVELPNLRHLKVVDEDQEDRSWAMALITPALRVYTEESKYCVVQEPRECTQSITHLRLERVPSMFPTQLRVLQLDISIEGFRSLIYDLKNRPSLCPHLDIFEFGQKYVTDFELAEMEKTLDEWDGQVWPGLLRPPTITANWSVNLPDEIEVEVRYR